MDHDSLHIHSLSLSDLLPLLGSGSSPNTMWIFRVVIEIWRQWLWSPAQLGSSPSTAGHTSLSLSRGTTWLPRFLIWNEDDTVYEVLLRGLLNSHSEFSPTQLRTMVAHLPYQVIRLVEPHLRSGISLYQHSWWTRKPWGNVSQHW